MKTFEEIHERVKVLLVENGYQYGEEASSCAAVGYMLALADVVRVIDEEVK